MELHDNQIQWQAPEIPKASYEKPNYGYLANAMDNLSRVSDDISNKLDRMQDDQLKADLKLAEERANKIIEDAASADADYDSLSERMLSEVQAAFYEYDEATRTRFNRENKTYFDELQLAVTDKVLKKKASQLINDVDLNIPLWASEAVAEGTWDARKRGLDKIQESLTGYASPEQIAKLSYRYNNYIDKANLTNLITDGSDAALARARNIINNPKLVASLDPYELSVFNARIKNQEIENAKAKAKAEDPLSTALVNTYAIYSGSGDTASAMELLKKVKLGMDVPYMDMDENGKLVVKYINTASMPEAQRLSIVINMKKYDPLNYNFERDKADYNSEVDEALILYQAASQNKAASMDEALQRIMELQDSPLYDYLESKTQKDMSAYVNEQFKARLEASFGEEQQIGIGLTSDKYIGNPASNVSRLLQSGSYQAGDTVITTTPDGRTIVSEIDSNWVNRLPDITNKYSPYKSNLTNAMLGTAQIYRDRFAKDMKDDSVAEFGLFNKILLSGMRDAGGLEDTRFKNLSNDAYNKAFSRWSYEMQRKGLYNEKINDDNAKNIERFYQILVGADSQKGLTENEKQVVDEVASIAKTGQTNREFGVAESLIKGKPSLVKKPTTMKGSNQQRNYNLMKTVEATKLTTRTEKAIEDTELK